MQPTERNPRFTNPLINSTSPYLRQHSRNPVFWYPWGREAISRARAENKPILLSIGYSTCYWCHVMEREVFENLSIASLMNRHFINIKVDREEHPELDEIYMVARQLMTHEGGWPNNVFLTPDLKPFYAGGTYAADESYGKPAFPRLIEWLHYAWTTQEDTVRKTADELVAAMQPHLVFEPDAKAGDAASRPAQLFSMLQRFYDARSGGFFQAPKFPHECYLAFLLRYYEHTKQPEALDMMMHTLGKMAAGGIYDHVGCGFHRYAVDKEWYVPHFEKMLYNQAQMARVYTDAARITGNDYVADIAKSILDFVSGPMTDGNGAFYAAIDAETDAVEGAYYAWTPEEIQKILTEEESNFFVSFYALADIPAFPGHKHAAGQVIIARMPLAQAAQERKLPYVQVAAMAAQVMNKLLAARNLRRAPGLDDKIIVSWNGLMIDAYAHAARVFNEPRYLAIAQKAANFILDKALTDEGKLCRIIAGGKAHIDATLEDYAFLVKGLLSLWRARGAKESLLAATDLMARAEELFADAASPGYFSSAPDEFTLIRIKSHDDSALPNANAIMAENCMALFAATGEAHYQDKAQALLRYFLQRDITVESASLCAAALLAFPVGKSEQAPPPSLTLPHKGGGNVMVSAELIPADAKPGDVCEARIMLDIAEGWHIQAHDAAAGMVPTQVDIQGRGVELLEIVYPEAVEKEGQRVYGQTAIMTARLKLKGKAKKRPKLKVLVRFQPCRGTSCLAVQDVSLSL